LGRMGRQIAKGGTRGTVFKAVAYERLLDAEVLLRRDRLGGAAYLSGYALECILKWAVTQRRETQYLPAELETHDLDLLLDRAGLSRDIKQEWRLRSAYSALAQRWGPEMR